jgi:phage FluMu protein Com
MWSLSSTANQLTIAELESLGYAHLRLGCPNCGHRRLASFFLLPTRRLITEHTTFLDLAGGLKCAKCRKTLPAESVRLVHQTETVAPRRKVRRDSL